MSYFLSEIGLSSSPARVKVQVLRKGEWKHPSAPGGVLKIDDETLSVLEDAFRSGVRGRELPVNLNHKQDDFVVGWLRDLKREGDALVGYVDVVDGNVAKAIQEQKLRYSSAEILFNYTDPESQQTFPVVLKGLAFTNYPFIKQMQPAEVVNLSEIEEVQHMEDRLKQLEAQMAQYEAQLRELHEQAQQLKEENAKLRQANDVLLAETRRQQDEILLKEYEDTVPPAVRKVVAALLAMTRGEEVQLSEFQADANRPAELRDLVHILLNEFKALGAKQVDVDELRIPERRRVSGEAEAIIQKAEEIAKQNGVDFGKALRMAYQSRR
jgi:uncharacterized coiled-coil protein SlyX